MNIVTYVGAAAILVSFQVNLGSWLLSIGLAALWWLTGSVVSAKGSRKRSSEVPN